MSVAAGWYSDPLGRHEYRYWGGGAWTEHVADRGITGEDPLSVVSTAPVSPSPVATAPPAVPAPVAAPTIAQAPPAVGAAPPAFATAPPAVGGPRTEVQVAPRRAGIGMVLVRVAAALLIALGTIQAVAVGTVGTRAQSTPFGETDGFADGFALARTNTSSSTTTGEGGTFSSWHVEYAGMGFAVLAALIAIIVLVPRTVRSVRQRVRRGEAPALVAEAAAAGAGPHPDPRAIVGKASYLARWIALLVLWLVVIGFTIYPITELEGPNFTVLPGGFVALALGLAGLLATLVMTPAGHLPRLSVDPAGHLYPAMRETEKVMP